MINDDVRSGQAAHGLPVGDGADRAYSREALDAGFAAVMERFDRLDPAEAAQIDLETTRAELGYEAYALGTEYLDRGELDRASRWLRVAVDLGVDEATPRLHDVDELRRTAAAFASVSRWRATTAPFADHVPASLEVPGKAGCGGFTAETVQTNAILLYARAEADRIVAEARQKADQILAAAAARTVSPVPPADGGVTWRPGEPLRQVSEILFLSCGSGKTEQFLIQKLRTRLQPPDVLLHAHAGRRPDLVITDSAGRVYLVEVKNAGDDLSRLAADQVRRLAGSGAASCRRGSLSRRTVLSAAWRSDQWQNLIHAGGTEAAHELLNSLHDRSYDASRLIAADPELLMRLLDWSSTGVSGDLRTAVGQLITPHIEVSSDSDDLRAIAISGGVCT